MPEMDGDTAAREIRAWEIAEGLARTPIIALTASTLGPDIERSFGAGCDTCLSKPSPPAVLLASVQQAIEIVTTIREKNFAPLLCVLCEARRPVARP